MTTHHSPCTSRSAASSRRGVLLLVILILLVIFVMMAVTYVLVATREFSSSKALATKDASGDPPPLLLDGAMHQLLSGSNNHNSPLYPHSLLEHMYGPYGITGTVNQVDPNGNSTADQITEFTATNPQPVDSSFYSTTSLNDLLNTSLKTEGYLDGCVITMTSGAANGLSSRIVRYDASNPSNPVFHVLGFHGAGGIIVPSKNDTFLINGRAFSGTGFGFNGNINPNQPNISGLVDAKNGDDPANPKLMPGGRKEFALLPNPVFYHPQNPTEYGFDLTNPAELANGSDYDNDSGQHVPFCGIGGCNTDYEAPDYQHMYLSFTYQDSNGLPKTILPSFHRPDLINYWTLRIQGAAGASWNWVPTDPSLISTYPNIRLESRDLLRQIMFRPIGPMKITPVNGTTIIIPSSNCDHPNFTGSNPSFDAIAGPWDVDNDGDGVPDSVWVDLGYPVQVTSDGRLYKPLFAILCVDLDSRLNLNASGSTEMIAPSSFTQSTHAQQFVGPGNTSSPPSGNLPYVVGPYAGTNTSATNPNPPPFSLPRGEGNGPADVDLYQYIFGLFQQYNPSQPTTNASDATQTISNLLHGGPIPDNTTQTLPGRYGAYNEFTSSEPMGSAEAGQTGVENNLALIGKFQFTDNLSIGPLSSFGSPADLWSRMAVGLDFRGQPLFWKPSWTNEAFTNCPYNLNLSVEGSAYDAPFTIHELERLLRPNDVDSAGLPSRLWELSDAGTITRTATSSSIPQGPFKLEQTQQQKTAMIEDISHNVTTDSWDPPSPGVVAPDYLRAQLATVYGRKFATNIVELLTARLLKENPGMSTAQISANIRRLLSPELIAGLRMNINRPLGDGRDGDNNGTVDEPSTAELGTEGKSSSANPWTWLRNSLQNMTWTTGMPSISLDLAGGMDVNGDGVVDAKDELMARQLLARHLYVLARLLINDTALKNTQNWFPKENLNTASLRLEAATRRLAQWAINVVDFMDPDNTMTPFEYDFYPFSATDPTTGLAKDPSGSGKTWFVDGIINDGINTSTDDTANWRGLVWGCERPELLITEDIAFHDRRVKDSTFDNGTNSGGGHGALTTDTTNPDTTFDQVRVPQGSAFFELYCTANPNQPQQSADLYDHSTGKWMLDLGKMAPSDTTNHVPSYPVWRLAITGPESNQTTATNDVQTQTQVNKFAETYSYDTGSLPIHLLKEPPPPPPLVNPTVERVIWFTSTNPESPSTGTYQDPPNPNQVYYQKIPGSTLLGCGQYAVIGPRELTRIGWSTNASTDPTSMYSAPGNEPAGAEMVLMPGSTGSNVQFFDHKLNGTDSGSISNYPDSSTIQPPLAIVVAANLTGTGWANTSPAARLDNLNSSTLNPHPTGIGISISEPLPGATYYSEPTIQRPAYDIEAAATDCYGWLNETDPANTGLKFLDQPEDSDPSRPLKQNNALATKTYINYKTVLLQRLANPLAPWNQFSNPYLTVDWMPVDLTVFNGQAKPTSADPDDPNANNPTVNFAARQRNGQLSGTYPYLSDYDIWMQQEFANKSLDDPPATTANDSTNTMVFPHQLKYYADGTQPIPSMTNLASPTNAGLGTGLHTFGFVNSFFQQAPPTGTTTQPPSPFGPLSASEVNGSAQHVGDPRQPFPWLIWNNRPYANLAELMMVPASHPGCLLHEFTLFSTPDTTANMYTADANSKSQRMPFGNYLNFFGSAKGTTEANLSLIFEYLRVPSPFVGTDTILDPQTFAWNGGTPGEPSSTPAGVEPAGTAGLHPPFNMISNYRDPGKININTIAGSVDATGKASSNIWNALIGGDPSVSGNAAPGSTFTDVVVSRQGYAGSAYSLNPANPSIFSNPFRSAAGYDMTPLSSLTPKRPTNVTIFRTGMDASGHSTTDTVPGSGVPSDAGSAADNPFNVLPLMSNKPALTPQTQFPSKDTLPPYNDATRNPYFMYQGLGHLTNKITTRSNVFAVWITVGYFEVTPWYGTNTTTGAVNTAGAQVFDTAHPDGYQLGQELKADTGEIERHRSFYIIDRSIPVGFERGLDLNDDKTVILKRFIE